MALAERVIDYDISPIDRNNRLVNLLNEASYILLSPTNDYFFVVLYGAARDQISYVTKLLCSRLIHDSLVKAPIQCMYFRGSVVPKDVSISIYDAADGDNYSALLARAENLRSNDNSSLLLVRDLRNIFNDCMGGRGVYAVDVGWILNFNDTT